MTTTPIDSTETQRKNILFLVTGMTPQIITETVWALACDPENEEQWVPDEIHAMSTEDGLNQIRKRLFEDGIFAQMQQDYPQLEHVQFGTKQLHDVANVNGQNINDLKGQADNEPAADAICAIVRNFTEQSNLNLHVSISGGRKTMGFYAGYALSLYGRAQDRMSHVLVEDKFESVNDFFYPTPSTHFVTNRSGKVLDAKDAKIWLASIPFVRMQYAIKDKHQLKQGKDSFSQVVNKINESFNEITVTLRLHDQTLIVNHDERLMVNELPPREFAMLHWFLDYRKQGKDGIVAPKVDANSKKSSTEDADYVQQITVEFSRYYEDLKNSSAGLMVDKKFFESVKSHLKSSLETKLGLELAAKIAIIQDSRGQPFYISLAPEQIEIVDSFKDK